MTGIRTLSMAPQQVLAAYVDNAKEGMYARVADETANGTSLRGYVDTSYVSHKNKQKKQPNNGCLFGHYH